MTAVEWQTEEDKKFRKDVASIAASMKELADFVSIARKWTPWAIAAIGILYPAVGHLIAQLPSIAK